MVHPPNQCSPCVKLVRRRATGHCGHAMTRAGRPGPKFGRSVRVWTERTQENTHCQGRGDRGGGQWGQLPPTWKLWECHPPPQLWTVDVVHFYFLFVFARELGSLLPKIVDKIQGVFSFGWGLPWTPLLTRAAWGVNYAPSGIFAIALKRQQIGRIRHETLSTYLLNKTSIYKTVCLRVSQSCSSGRPGQNQCPGLAGVQKQSKPAPAAAAAVVRREAGTERRTPLPPRLTTATHSPPPPARPPGHAPRINRKLPGTTAICYQSL